MPKGTKVTCSAIFDNSPDNPKNPNNPPQPVFLGEATTDEMLLPLLMLSSEKIVDTGDGSGFMGFWTSMMRSWVMRDYYYDRLPFEVQPDGTVLRVGYTTSDSVFHRLKKPVDPTVPQTVYRKDSE